MSWLQRLFARRRMEIDLDRELRFHLEAPVVDKVRSGIPESEASRLTRLEFGGIEQIKEDCRRSRGTLWLESIAQDVRYGLRQLRNSPEPFFSPDRKKSSGVRLACSCTSNQVRFHLLDRF